MIIDLNSRPRELGRLRMGEKGSTVKNGRTITFPKRRTEWRLTSEDQDILEAAAELYGGTVREWTDAPTEAKQWELPTDSDAIDVLVPPVALANPISQFFELWSGGGCQRRCNGQVEVMTGERCVCPVDYAERMALAAKGQACSPVTRLSVFLPRLPDIGVWRVEAHGYNAAVELPASAEFLSRLSGRDQWVVARLVIQTRTKRKDGKTTHFVVPILSVPDKPLGELLGAANAVGSGHRQGLDGGQAALLAGAPDPFDDEERDGEDSTGEGTSEPRAADAGAAPAIRAQSGAPGGVFARSIRTTAKRLHIDDDLLSSVVEEVSGQPDVDAIHDPGHGNAILAELTKVAEQRKAANA